MYSDPQVIELVKRAGVGEESAWHELVERYSTLIWSICRRYELDRADAEDVTQAVWLHLVKYVDSLRDPAALPGWLVTTTRRECGRVRQTRLRSADVEISEAENLWGNQIATAEDGLLMAERHAALREAFMDLPANCQQLLSLLITEPPTPYAEISARLGIPMGSIGPNRSRCLERLRRHPAIAALIDA
jgi:RNA polymerase sigma factor (sigma-70 family)